MIWASDDIYMMARTLNLQILIGLTCFLVNHYFYTTSQIIRRGDRDIFDNPTCLNATSDPCNDCREMNAECETYSECRECTCSRQYGTYLPHLRRCVNDNILLSFAVENNSVMIQDYLRPHDCVSYNPVATSNNITMTKCNQSDLSQKWIWTPDNLLLHQETLKCVEQGEAYLKSNDKWSMGLEECNNSKATQKWECNVRFVRRKGLPASTMSIYMVNDAGFIRAAETVTDWQRYDSQELCSNIETADPLSTMLVISSSSGRRQIASVDLTKHPCSVKGRCLQISQYSNTSWKELQFTRGSFSIKNNNLKWNLTKAHPSCANSILRLNFRCNSSKHTSCIVIKLTDEWLNDSTAAPSTSTVSPSKVTKNFATRILPSTEISPSLSTQTVSPFKTQNPTSSTGKSSRTINTPVTNPTSRKEKQKDESSNVVSIVVGVLVAALVLCALAVGFVLYRKRRLKKSPSNVAMRDDGQSGNTLNPIYSSADKSDGSVYQEPGYEVGAVSQACDLYEPCDDNEYDYAKVDQKPPSAVQEQEYDYAKNDDIRYAVHSGRIDGKHEHDSNQSDLSNKNDRTRGNGNQEDADSDTGPVYQTLESDEKNETGPVYQTLESDG